MWRSYRHPYLRFTLILFGFHLLGGYHLHGQTITWSEHVAPILYENCTACHHDGGAGPFSLMSYDEVKEHAEEIVEVVTTRAMPPWKIDPLYSPKLVDHRPLSDEQVAHLKQWVEQGSRRGSSRRAPRPPKYSEGWTGGEPDLVLQLSEPITLSGDGAIIVRNFVVPVPITEPHYIRSIEFLPQSYSVIKNAIIQLDESDWSRRKDASDLTPGFEGMDTSGADNPTGQLANWLPGIAPYQARPDAAWSLKPNMDLLLQLRVRPSGEPETINPRIGLYFAEDPPTASTASLLLQAPASAISSGEASTVLEESLEVPVKVSVLSVAPRAHDSVSEVQVFAELPTGEQVGLLRIPDWDSDWQHAYQYQEPLEIPAGSRLVMQYTWDGNDGGREIEGVAEATIGLILQAPDDRAVIQQTQTDYEIRKAGGIAEYFYNEGAEMESIGRIQEAITAYERAVQEDPSHARANNGLGMLFEFQGNKTQAEYYYREAFGADNSFHVARLNLARFFRKANRQEAAAKILQEALDLDPGYLDARLELSVILGGQKLLRSAIKLLEDGLKIDPLEPYLNLQTGKLYVLDRRPEVAISFLEKAAQGTEANQKFEFPLSSILVEANFIPARIFQASGNIERMNFHLDEVFKVDPTNLEARVFIANLLLEGRQETEARKHLEILLKQPLEAQPRPEDLIKQLSFPQGVMLLADIYKRMQRQRVGKGILEQALLVAEQRGNLIWITQIQNEIARYR